VATKEGRTVLFVSHNMATVKSLCQDGVFLAQGRISYKGTAEGAIKTYLKKMEFIDQENDLMHYRKTRGSEIITKIVINESSEWSVPKINIGGEVNVRLYLHKNPYFEQIHIGIGIDNEMGERIFTVSTRNQNIEIKFLANNLIVDCHLNQINIAPGVYYLKIAIADSYQDIDIVEFYPGFEVIPSDYYGTGKLPFRSQGILIMEALWERVNE
jgi:lipopolysaccharide transport system ATP-binding protein